MKIFNCLVIFLTTSLMNASDHVGDHARFRSLHITAQPKNSSQSDAGSGPLARHGETSPLITAAGRFLSPINELKPSSVANNNDLLSPGSTNRIIEMLRSKQEAQEAQEANDAVDKLLSFPGAVSQGEMRQLLDGDELREQQARLERRKQYILKKQQALCAQKQPSKK